MADAFRATAAEVHGVSEDMILAGNGSDDLLAIALRTFCGPGDRLAYPEPTYSLYPVLSRLADVAPTPVPWQPGWTLPIEELCATGARAIFFANPNAPSGTVVSRADVAALARRFAGLVLVDEAYIDFADPDTDCLPLLGEHENVIVTRTLSKGYALAGLRFGYAVGHRAIVAELAKVKDSYNCDALSIAAASAALGDRAHAAAGWAHVRRERDRLTTELQRRGFAVIPSQANFLLTTVPGGDALSLYQRLRAAGILIRYFEAPGLLDKIRITIGTVAENDALLAALGDAPATLPRRA
jgi:histidinol-phosphate aminotransferase